MSDLTAWIGPHADSAFQLLQRARSSPAETTPPAGPTASAERPDRRAVHALQRLALIREGLGVLDDDVLAVRHQTTLADLESTVIDRLLAGRNARSGLAPVTVAVVGDFSSGKSTFINALLGRPDLCPVDPRPTTSSITFFSHGANERYERERDDGRRSTISRAEYVAGVQHGDTGGAGDGPFRFHVQVNAPELTHIRLVDTPGFNNPKNAHDASVTREAVRAADVLFVIFDIHKGNPSADLLKQLHTLREAGANDKPAYLLINKAADKRARSERTQILEDNRRKHAGLFRDLLLLDSKRMAAPEESDAVRNLRGGVDGALSALYRRHPFELTIRAERKASATGNTVYALTVDGAYREIGVLAFDDLATREKLLELVREVERQQNQLLADRSTRADDELTRHWRDELTKLLRDLRTPFPTGAGASQLSDNLREAGNWLKRRVTQSATEYLCYSWEGAVRLHAHENKGVLWSDHRYQVRFHSDEALVHLEDRSALQVSKRAMESFNRQIQGTAPGAGGSLDPDAIISDFIEYATLTTGGLFSQLVLLTGDRVRQLQRQVYPGVNDGLLSEHDSAEQALKARDKTTRHLRDASSEFVERWWGENVAPIVNGVLSEAHKQLGARENASTQQRKSRDKLIHLVQHALEFVP